MTKTNVNHQVQQLLEQLVSTDQETGIQVAAYLDGQLVVDAWAGLADPERGRPMDGDTLINVWSAGKGVAATTIHALVERGVLEYDAPLTRYWPEYGANGKERTTVAHVLSHSAGVPQLPPDAIPEQVTIHLRHPRRRTRVSRDRAALR